MTVDAVAHAMGISVRTVKRETRAVRERLGATCDEDIYRDLGWLRVPNG